MEKEIIYVGNFDLNKSDAQAQLVIGNALILRELGYKVTVIDNKKSTESSYFGFSAEHVRFNKNVHSMLRPSEYHAKLVNKIEGYNNVFAVFCYGSPAFAVEIKYLKEYCKAHNIKFVMDGVDLSSTAHGTVIERIIKTYDLRKRQKYTALYSDGIIAVSTYIARYFRKISKANITIIPPIRDTANIMQPAQVAGVKSIVYVGVPFPIDGRKVSKEAYKDRLDLAIELFCKVKDKIGSCFTFDIYGLNEDQYLNVVVNQKNLVEKNRDVIKFHGKVSHNEAIEAVRNASYTILYRLKNQVTMAGFSTKLAESISCGTPVIMTDTSDYKSYLRESEYVIIREKVDENINKVSDALLLSNEKLNEMKKECYLSKKFDFRNYVAKMSTFLDGIDNDDK